MMSMMIIQDQKTPTMSGNWNMVVVPDTTKQDTANPVGVSNATITFLDESAREQYVRETTTRFIMKNKDLFDRLAKE